MAPIACELRLAIAMIGLALISAPAAAEKGGDTGASPTAELQQESADALDALADFSAEQKEQAADTARGLVERLDQRIQALRRDLENNWDDMDEARRRRQEAMIESLARQRDELKDQLSGLAERSGAAWEELKSGFVRSYRALKGSDGENAEAKAITNSTTNSDQ